ncbi:MAG: GNAT family N-acetyltransferase [Eubacteriales bacterium]|nr:GNAT family N-acetyltransferase [Eubacteriales bacterium]
MEYSIRAIKADEYPLLDDFLYEAIFIPEGMEPPPKKIIQQPELQVYVSEFGKKDDHCLVAEADGKIVGAVWARIMKDYGHIDDDTPSLAISLWKEYRGLGIGTALMQDMLQLLRSRGYRGVSLSVQKVNYAHKMYRTVGFAVVSETQEEYSMICRL